MTESWSVSAHFLGHSEWVFRSEQYLPILQQELEFFNSIKSTDYDLEAAINGMGQIIPTILWGITPPPGI